jgi:transcriptional regulator with XRE-family HTH domain
MTFHDLHGALIDYLNQCVQSGEITERGLARRTGISQPHIHNTLKGKRLFSWESADAILRELDLDLLDLIDRSEFVE